MGKHSITFKDSTRRDERKKLLDWKWLDCEKGFQSMCFRYTNKIISVQRTLYNEIYIENV